MTNVFFRPWVGENYKSTGFNGKHILVLGESCFCGECPGCATDGHNDWWEEEEWQRCRDLIPDVVTDFLAYKNGDPKNWSMRSYRRFTDVFMGRKCTPEETQAFWNSFVLYNYVQTSLEGPRISPSQEEWATGEKPFFEVLAEYTPDVIIAWGRRLWNNMPAGFRLDDSFQNRWGDGLRYYNNGKRDIPVYACYHPSTPAFSSEDTDYFKRLLEKVSEVSK
ncbi:MAG: uracil-DNA glycosylase family protein [Treponema sp.]|nr:uracil-DNA glycosylase family protein [Treponema sp.]